MLAGIWNEWVDPETGELVPSYSMLTINCDDHPLLRSLAVHHHQYFRAKRSISDCSSRDSLLPLNRLLFFNC